MTEQTWQGKAFAPVFYRKLAEWHERGEVGPDPRTQWVQRLAGARSVEEARKDAIVVNAHCENLKES